MEFIHEFRTYVEMHKQQALDQAILMVTSSNPPPFETDLRLMEFIDRRALELKPSAERQA